MQTLLFDLGLEHTLQHIVFWTAYRIPTSDVRQPNCYLIRNVESKRAHSKLDDARRSERCHSHQSKMRIMIEQHE